MQLYDYQKPVVDNVLTAWKKGFPAIISSMTGSGKTYMATECAKQWEANYVFVIAPKSSLSKWDEVLTLSFPEKKRRQLFTYDKWRICNEIVKGKVIEKSNPYTIKRTIGGPTDHLKGENKNRETYSPSKKWLILIKNRRVILIVDEFHKIQKRSKRTMAISSNTRSITVDDIKNRGTGISKVLFLSYTPNDKAIDVCNNVYSFGFIQDINVIKYNRSIEEYDTDDLTSFFNIVKELNRDNMNFTVNKSVYIDKIKNIEEMKGSKTRRVAREIVKELFISYIKNDIVFSCTPDYAYSDLYPDYYNYFYRIDDDLYDFMKSLFNACIYKDKGEYGKRSLMTRIMAMFIKSEQIKSDLYYETANKWLIDNPKGKVCIMALFLDDITFLKERLKEYHPVLIKGSMSIKERDISVKKFNEWNTDCRVIICTLQTGGEAIDLHDTSPGGEYKRLMIIPPNYSTKPVVQAAGRVFRQGVTSKASIYVLYTCKNDSTIENVIDNSPEFRIYKSVQEKTATIKDYHSDLTKKIFPCNYTSLIN